MSPAYLIGVRDNFGNATVAFDKFHVVSQVTEAVEAVRRKEVRQDPLAHGQLEKTWWLWRKNPCHYPHLFKVSLGLVLHTSR